MHRFYLRPEQCQSQEWCLREGEAHHAIHVLRLRQGECVLVLDGAGHEYGCEVNLVGRDQVQLGVLNKRFVPRLPYQVTLLQALPKGKLIESIIQKATELGVARIVPLLSERVLTRLTEKEGAGKVEKWETVAIEALKQSGSTWLPTVDLPQEPREFLSRAENFELGVVGSLQPDGKHPREYFRAFREEQGRRPVTVSIWVGPEGDFTLDELALVQSTGVRPITLGRQVLRTETAAIYCLSIVNYELQDPAEWSQ